MSIFLPPCKTCKFWCRPFQREVTRGKCLRYPPQCHQNGGAEWPVTSENDACGEHKLKEGQGDGE